MRHTIGYRNYKSGNICVNLTAAFKRFSIDPNDIGYYVTNNPSLLDSFIPPKKSIICSHKVIDRGFKEFMLGKDITDETSSPLASIYKILIIMSRLDSKLRAGDPDLLFPASTPLRKQSALTAIGNSGSASSAPF